MAIVQISRITNRKGLQENLPQLAGAELGWSIDERRLYIGNGTLQEGAPVIGNTEILTEFSDIINIAGAYTYQGAAGGYIVQTGPTPSSPITQSLQSWLDQFATVKDFGAVGDGVTDDTNAINRALYQLYCIDNATQTRRSLFFPAGTYRITDTIYIPAYATLVGEGADGSVIQMISLDDSTNKPVAQTVASLVLAGDGVSYDPVLGATESITITDLGFRNANEEQNVFVFQNATACSLKNIGFYGPLTTASITDPNPNTACVTVINTAGQYSSNIAIDTSEFTGTIWGLYTNDQVKGLTISNSSFYGLYQGVALGIGALVGNGPTGVRITGNSFDTIYAEGIVFGNVSLNASAQNIFYNVGNHLNGTTQPATAVIDIQDNDNVSWSDLFERSDAYSETYPRVDLNSTRSIGSINGKQIELGTFTRESGLVTTLVNNTPGQTTFVSRNKVAMTMTYTIVRGTSYQSGTLTVTNNGLPVYTDDYVETGSTGVILYAVDVGGTTEIQYTTTNTGTDAQIYYSISYLPTFV